VLLTYPKAQGIIQASWNWPYDRKDIEIYGTSGTCSCRVKIYCAFGKAPPKKANSNSRLRRQPVCPATNSRTLPPWVRGEIRPSGPSSLELNLIVTEILDAARESARIGKRIDLPPSPPF